MKMLICGFGNIGKHIYNEFQSISYDISIYDPFYERDFYIDPNQNFIPNLNIYFDIAFVCVPTDMLSDGSCDISIVEDVVSQINADVIVIKSTVPVGTSKMLCEKYNKHIVFSPEYYGTTIHSPKSPNFLILGGDKKACDKVANLYHRVKTADFTIRFTDLKTAELAKYMENGFLAAKVTFCAEFFEIAKAMGVSYNELREIFVMDNRMGKSHTYIDPDKPYYDSHCLNKDIPAMLKQCEGIGIMPYILAAVFNKNKRDKG